MSNIKDTSLLVPITSVNVRDQGLEGAELLLPIIDISHYIELTTVSMTKRERLMTERFNSIESLHLAYSMKKYSAVIIRDPRITEINNSEFLDQMEEYFSQPDEKKLRDVRKEFNYQVGVTPEFTEQPICVVSEDCHKLIDSLLPENKPSPLSGKDPKWRFHWNIGPRPYHTEFKSINPDPVIPEGFPNWKKTMDKWGNLLHDSVKTVSNMLQFGLEINDVKFSKMAEYGNHLLAPTGIDLEKYGKVGNTIAGLHKDLSFLSIHGKSRYPGLFIWYPENGILVKRLVKIPKGCLLVQAGLQLEHLTGGAIKAGYHEVSVTSETLEAMKTNKSKIRVSSTLFYHIASDNMLSVVKKYRNEKTMEEYPDIKTGNWILKQLSLINI